MGKVYIYIYILSRDISDLEFEGLVFGRRRNRRMEDGMGGETSEIRKPHVFGRAPAYFSKRA